jgi:2-phosphosulfolactate phosphatase
MEFKRTTLQNCHAATGTVVVIDVLRAFTTAAYAFAAGARDIVLVSTVEEAFALREHTRGALIMGEVGGLPVPGFDFGNSPSALIGLDLSGRRLIQRTSAGTQGVVHSTLAETLLAASLVCAGATIRYIRQNAPAAVTFVITGAIHDLDGEEDAACADYMIACLQGKQPDIRPFIERVYNANNSLKFVDPARPELPIADLERATEVDRFGFAMPVKRHDGLLIMEKVEVK